MHKYSASVLFHHYHQFGCYFWVDCCGWGLRIICPLCETTICWTCPPAPVTWSIWPDLTAWAPPPGVIIICLVVPPCSCWPPALATTICCLRFWPPWLPTTIWPEDVRTAPGCRAMVWRAPCWPWITPGLWRAIRCWPGWSCWGRMTAPAGLAVTICGRDNLVKFPLPLRTFWSAEWRTAPPLLVANCSCVNWAAVKVVVPTVLDTPAVRFT